ncbi:MAG: replicative DNA helicase [Alphaproteobacteria bacterium]|nr:replicative DNA helicase [Alphaproteobacteria bacterium]
MPSVLLESASVDTLMAEQPAAYREAPSNIEAEQALLGALLVNNDALQHLGEQLRAEHFYEALHSRIFEAIQKFHDKGLIANPVTLRHYFDQDEALADIGGGAYLAKLAASAVTVINIGDYSRMIYDLALKRQLIAIGEEVVNTAYTHQIDIPSEVQIEAAEQKLFHLSVEGVGDKGFKALKHSVIGAIKHAEHAYKHQGVIGLTSGFIDLDRILGGLHRSDLLILAGRPSMGKTALAVNIAYKACQSLAQEARKKNISAKEAGCVGFFSLEMSSEQLATRLLSSASGLNSAGIFNGKISQEEFSHLVRTSNELATMPFFIDDTPALSIAGLRTRARRLKRVHNLKLLVVDYLQLVRGSASKANENRVQEVSEITQGLKAIAKELDIPVIALSQLSRQVENRGTKPRDKIPQLADLRESGSIEQDADVVMFIYREEYYLSREQPQEGTPEHATWQVEMDRAMNIAEVIIAKHRNGPIDTARLRFEGRLTQFSDLDEHHQGKRF